MSRVGSRAAFTSLATIVAVAAQIYLTSAAPAASGPCDEACWQDAVGAYVANPQQARQRLLALQPGDLDGLPPAVLLLLADAHLRAGERRTAAKLFDRAASDDTPEPLRTWALLGESWVELRSGDQDRALALLAQTDERAFFDPAVALLRGFLEAVRDDPAGATRLASLAEEPRATRDVRDAARMALGLVAYWAGHTAQAQHEFDRLASDPDAGVLEDEARYAAARVVLAEGRRAEATTRLEQLVASAPANAPAGKPAPQLLDLEKQAILRQGFVDYRRAPLESPAGQVVRLLDWNGVALARGLLARLARQDEAADEPQHDALQPIEAEASVPADLVVARAADETVPREAVDHAAAGQARHTKQALVEQPGRGLGTVVLVLFVAACAAVLVLRGTRGRAL